MAHNRAITDQFIVNDIDPDETAGRYERVSRIVMKSTTHGFDMIIDINSEIFPVEIGQRLTVVITSSVSPDGQAPLNYEKSLVTSPHNIIKDYSYACFGQVYHVDRGDETRSVYASFGGLLCWIKGPTTAFEAVDTDIDRKFFVLMRDAKAS